MCDGSNGDLRQDAIERAWDCRSHLFAADSIPRGGTIGDIANLIGVKFVKSYYQQRRSLVDPPLSGFMNGGSYDHRRSYHNIYFICPSPPPTSSRTSFLIRCGCLDAVSCDMTLPQSCPTRITGSGVRRVCTVKVVSGSLKCNRQLERET